MTEPCLSDLSLLSFEFVWDYLFFILVKTSVISFEWMSSSKPVKIFDVLFLGYCCFKFDPAVELFKLMLDMLLLPSLSA